MDYFLAKVGAIIAGPVGFLAFLGMVLAAAIRAVPSLFKTKVDATGAFRADQARRILTLERRVDEANARCDEETRVLGNEITKLNGRIYIVAQSTLELGSEVQRYNPDSPALARMREAFRVAFPVEVLPDKFAEMAKKLDETHK